MSFADSLMTEASYTRTMNGAVAHATTLDECLDFFAVAGGMRYRSRRDQIALFEKAYIANPELAMKLLFYIRDIRGGMGERQMFRTLIQHVAKMWPESAKKNVHLISEYGRWDDLLCLLGTHAEAEVVQVVREQLAKDLDSLKRRDAGELDAPISLLAKWLPSDNTSSKVTRTNAKLLYEALGMSRKEYRKAVVSLRAQICLTENYLTKKAHRKINYEAVPSKAMFKYRKAFETKDSFRFDRYLEQVASSDKKIHCTTLDPFEILRPYYKPVSLWKYTGGQEIDKTMEVLWKNLPGEVQNENAVVVVDTSGSMYWTRNEKDPSPALVSQALGIYYAERCKGIFHNKVITFESRPRVYELKGATLRDKIRYLQAAPWGGSTNMEAVFDLILKTAVANQAKQEELPSVIYIISDMEFNCAFTDPNKSVYENAKIKFEAHGYQLPAVVFHNVNSWQMQTPVGARTRGTALVSGFGTASLGQNFDGNMTPFSHMLKVLNGKRYEPVHA